MVLTVTTFFIASGVAILGLIALVYKLQKENDRYTAELEFFLRQRTIAHNRAKAEVAVLKTKMTQLQAQNQQAIDHLLEISAVKSAKDSNIKETISDYISQLDGLSATLNQVALDFTEKTKSFREKDADRN